MDGWMAGWIVFFALLFRVPVGILIFSVMYSSVTAKCPFHICIMHMMHIMQIYFTFWKESSNTAL